MKSIRSFLALFSSVIIIIYLLSSLSFQVAAQTTEPAPLSKVNLYADAGGHFAGQVSLNIEVLIESNEKVTWYGRGGVGAAGIVMANGGPGALGAITMLSGKGNRHFEVNTGVFVGKDNEQDDLFVYPLLDVGYRYQKPEGGFIFRAKVGLLGIGFGIGYAF